MFLKLIAEAADGKLVTLYKNRINAKISKIYCLLNNSSEE